jgi:proteasome lid subunit RPN8/RPN11
VIVWNERKPDFCRKPVDDLLPDLTFTAACAVVLGHGHRPKVVVQRRVLDGVWTHLSQQSVEMGGLLIGKVHDLQDSDDQFVVSLEDFARADLFDGTGVSLRMDTTVWEAARERVRRDRFVIGWYHSHPNLGAFFSGTDRRTQRAFFCYPHCLGLVVDPIRREEKWFMGPDAVQLEPRQILLED